MAYPAALTRLVKELEKLPGVGPRTAERLAHFLVGGGSGCAQALAGALEDACAEVRACSRCHQLTDRDPCQVCTDRERDRSRLLVVEQPRDVESMERAGWRGVYHVLAGSVTTLDGMRSTRGAELDLEALGRRLAEGEVREVVLATNPDLEGDGNALAVSQYVQRVAGERVAVSRLARGVPTGSALEYTNPAVLAEAIELRRPMRSGDAS